MVLVLKTISQVVPGSSPGRPTICFQQLSSLLNTLSFLSRGPMSHSCHNRVEFPVQRGVRGSARVVDAKERTPLPPNGFRY